MCHRHITLHLASAKTKKNIPIYDEARKALYLLTSGTFKLNEETMRIYFQISRDNGQTFSEPIDISTTDFAMRGYQSMALDTTGDLYVGFYDGHNDSTFKSLEYFGAVITAAELDQLVNEIPLSNPLYNIPASPAPVAKQTPITKQIQSPVIKYLRAKLGDRLPEKVAKP